MGDHPDLRAKADRENPWAASCSTISADVLPVPEISNMTIFVATLSTSIEMPSISARPSARRLAFAWSSCKPVGAFFKCDQARCRKMPTCRMPPPRRFRQMRASLMNSFVPSSIEPTGAPRPFESVNITESQCRVRSATGCIQSDRGVEDAGAVHVDRQSDGVCLLADIDAGLGRHHAAAGEIVRVFEADQAGRGLVIRRVDLQRRLDLVPGQMTRAVAAFDRPDGHARDIAAAPSS